MIDPILERHYSDCRELLNLWRRFHDFFKVAVAGETITSDREHEFITIKSRIAMLHDSFMDSLDHDQNIGQNVLTIVTRSITLKHVHRMSTAEIKKIELEWHESYLLLNEAIGLLEDKRRQFAGVSSSKYYRELYTKKALNSLSAFIHGWVFKTMVAVVILMVLGFAAVQYGFLDWMSRNPTTRSFLVKGEELIRMVYKEYPYRDLASWTRMDANLSQIVKLEDSHAEAKDKFRPDDGINRLKEAMGSGATDIAAELKMPPETMSSVDFRTEVYAGGLQMGGSNAILWSYRKPTVAIARSIESKYRIWLSQQPAGTKPDWALFRSSNAVGILFGGDQEGQMRDYLVEQYTHMRRPRKSL